jgi:hypothetical protein
MSVKEKVYTVRWVDGAYILRDDDGFFVRASTSPALLSDIAFAKGATSVHYDGPTLAQMDLLNRRN